MLKKYIKSNSDVVIDLTIEVYKYDLNIVEGVKNQDLTLNVVLSWMQLYGLLRGKTSDIRQQLGNTFIQFAYDSDRKNRTLSENFSELFNRLFDVYPQSWLSATSKLLWCCYPEEAIIYDAFAYKSLSILEKLHPAFNEIEGMKSIPWGGQNLNVDDFIRFYKSYCESFMTLLQYHENDFKALEERFPDYP